MVYLETYYMNKNILNYQVLIGNNNNDYDTTTTTTTTKAIDVQILYSIYAQIMYDFVKSISSIDVILLGKITIACIKSIKS